uniref:Odorant-binding protein 18 n=1 Tax=Microplitis mediator TaxID=375433 RepID=A0A219T7U0_9HYME|nr:odorant-binding protein 18 [Microplitis mediator]
MRYSVFVFVGILFTFFISSDAESSGEKECPLKKAFQESIDACKDKLSEENLALLEKDENADNEDIRCFKACILNDSGVMSNGKIQIDKIEEAINAAIENVKEDEEKAKAIGESMINGAKNCAGPAEEGENECEVAHRFITCLMEHAAEEKKKHNE